MANSVKRSLHMTPVTLTIYSAMILFFTYLYMPSSIQETDVFLHTTLGNWILNGNAASGNPSWVYGPQNYGSWTNTQGLVEVIFSTLNSLFGWWGVALIQTLAPALIALTIYLTALMVIPTPVSRKTQIPAYITILLTGVALYIISPAVSLRPQTFSYVITPLAVLIIYRIAVTGVLPKLYVIPGLTFIWCLFHGYGILFLPTVLIAYLVHHAYVYALSDKDDRLKTFYKSLIKSLPVITISFVLTLLTPAGIGLYTSAIKIREASSNLVSEWNIVDLQNSAFWLLLLMIAGYLTVFAYTVNCWTVSSKAKIIQLASEVTVLAFIIAGLSMYVRTSVYAAYVLLLFILIRILLLALQKKHKMMSRETLVLSRFQKTLKVLIFFVLIVSIVTIPAVKFGNTEENKNIYPTSLISTILKDGNQHAIFTDYNLSSYVLYKLTETGNGSVSIDGRTDLYGNKIIKNYIQLSYDKNITDDERTTLWIPYRNATDVVIYKNTPLHQYLLKNGYKAVQSLPAVTVEQEETKIVWLTKN